MRKIIESFIIGAGYGSIIYSLSLYVQGVQTQSLANIISVMLFSGLIGLCSLLFDWEDPPFIYRLGLHFILVFSLIVLMNWYNGFTTHFISIPFLVIFLLSYGSVWVVSYFLYSQKVDRINKSLKERREKLGK